MPKITKLCLHLLKLCRKHSGLFFPDTVYDTIGAWDIFSRGAEPSLSEKYFDSARKKIYTVIMSFIVKCFDRLTSFFFIGELLQWSVGGSLLLIHLFGGVLTTHLTIELMD